MTRGRLIAVVGPSGVGKDSVMAGLARAAPDLSLDSPQQGDIYDVGDPVVLDATATDPDDLMPPPDSKRTLSAGERELIRRWIEQGARWQNHWAFIPPKRPSLPLGQAQPGNAIDHFVAVDAGERETLEGNLFGMYTVVRRPVE